jgi:NAD(P)H-flavin reductase
MGKLHYFPVVQAPDENWQSADGHVNLKMIKELMPEKNEDDSLIIVCGPPKMKESVKIILDEEGYSNYFIF